MRRYPLAYFHNVIRVAPSGPAHARSLADALAMVKSPGANNRWLIELAPGDYQISATIAVPRYVTVRGAFAGEWQRDSWASRIYVGAGLSTGISLLGALCDVLVHTAEAQATTFYLIYAYSYSVIDRCCIDCAATATGGANCYALYLSASDGHVLIYSTLINRASGFTNVVALYGRRNAEIDIEFCKIRAYGTGSYGLLLDTPGYCNVKHSHIEAETAISSDRAVTMDHVSFNGTLSANAAEQQIVSSTRHGFMTAEMYGKLGTADFVGQLYLGNTACCGAAK
ncbi:MAG TPA: hypothetical protein G4O02_13285 [Caldilineae bacterium]|nr:hypothetical protein [Caldilineae bacterium]